MIKEAILETKRLYLREFRQSDVDDLFVLDSDPEVHKHLGNTPITDKKTAADYIKNAQQQYKTNGFGRWAMIEKSSANFVGWCGIRLYTDYTFNNHTNFHDIGYRLRKEFWGKGYATEASKACLQYAWEHLKLDTLYGITAIENAASHTVLLKIGFTFTEEFFYEPEQMQLRWYEMKNPMNYG